MTDRNLYRPRPRPLDVVVVEGEPLAQISIYEDLTLLTRWTGTRWTQYPIAAEALAQVLGAVPVASGLLPAGTLGVGRVHGEEFTVLYIPARVRTLRMEVGSYTIPLPPLIWAGRGTDYRIWALATPDYPTRSDAPLMVAPFPNCYRSGAICWGTSDLRPAATPLGLAKVLKLFLEESYFNLHLANGKSVGFPVSVVARWQQLAEAASEAYPLDDLMPAECQLGWLLEGGPWTGGTH